MLFEVPNQAMMAKANSDAATMAARTETRRRGLPVVLPVVFAVVLVERDIVYSVCSGDPR